jgi:DNA-directed RNA polymerase subunit RPC12/RpoP
MGHDKSDELTGLMLIVPHGIAPGVECCGCIVAVVEDKNVELQCNECGAVLGVIQIDVLRGLLGLDAAKVTCPHCGKLNTFPGFSKMLTYICQHCGKTVDASERTRIEDDTCRWYEFENEEPIAVLRCNRCGRHPDVDEDGVMCPLCRNHSPVRSSNIIDVIKAWNDLVDPQK